MNSYIKDVSVLRRALRIAAVEAFKSEVIDTDMYRLVIGQDLEYHSADDWITDRINEWMDEAEKTT